ncbi:SUMF1/EgtB/PvdO family nonheme iron enzyme [Haliscomenobacter sp.]|uniref:SUMF1/EgtB/PvdO family nonheme iron enzyme n=1 Tax=Haliscomenobacter sp. TaxID=2717303 RepID=UPI003364CA68
MRQVASGSNRVLRGGSWNNNPQNVRAANRNNNTPDNRNNNIGCRLANTGKQARIWLLYGSAGSSSFCPAACLASPHQWGDRIFIQGLGW